MNSGNDLCGKTGPPLYNSQNIKTFLEYVSKFHPEVKIDAVLSYAGMNNYEVDDPGHWFSQDQIDRFYEVLVAKTENLRLSRDVGRYASASQASGILRQYALGFIGPGSAYAMLPKLASNVTRSSTMRVNKLKSNKVEVIVVPEPGTFEKAYQCENRIGMFESLAKLFTNKFPAIEHPDCLHRGAEIERYVISWERSPSLFWKRFRNYYVLIGILVSGALFFALPVLPWIALVLLGILIFLIISARSESLEKRDLLKNIEVQGDAARDRLEEINRRYNDALLVQEIGQATSAILDIPGLLKTVMKTMEKRLDFDRGMVMLANKKRNRLVYMSGYGYGPEAEEALRSTEFHLDNPESKGLFVVAFKDQKPFLINDINENSERLSRRSRELAQKMGVKSLICVPIVYEKQTLGILAVDNIESKRPLTQSDISLLLGVASQSAVSIINAQSFQRVQESEKKYRELVENANSIILRMNIKGNIIFFNEFAQKFFGYSEEEIIGENVLGKILPHTQSAEYEHETLVKSLGKDPEKQAVRESEHILRSGDSVWIAWTYRPIFDRQGKFIEILCIGNDVTELRRAEEEKKALEAQLQHAQRMEAIGTLAGGIAHDFNNILGAIIGFTELAIYEAGSASRVTENMGEVLKAGHRAKDLVRQILAFSRQTDRERKPILISPIVKEALKLLRASVPTTIDIRQNIEADVGSILADPTQIHQVLMNLCTNASHSMAEKGGVMEVSLANVEMAGETGAPNTYLQPGSYLRLTVSDTGYGMDRKTMERIFDPYFTTKAKGVGTGLGLAVVHGIVKSHNGEITVHSKAGKGTTFHVYFPRIKEVAQDERKVSEPPLKGNERILFVDDEEALVLLAKQMLERLGYHVQGQMSSSDALEVFRAQPEKFDLVITDLTMPDMKGDRLAQEILKIRPDMAIILCTGFTGQITEEQAKEIGVGAFVLKPLEMNEIAKTIRELLD